MHAHGKPVSFFQPVSKTNGATASGYIDRLGHDFLLATAILSQSDNATNKPSVMKLQHSDTTDASNFADITGFVGGTSFTVGSQATGASNVHHFRVDLRGKKRYIQMVVSPVTTQVIAGHGLLTRAKEAPYDATTAGCANFVEG
jgi:hypothetical protein